MESKAKTYEEAAMECVAKLSDEDIEFFRMHIGYTYHHFGYGLYLRNQYSYLLDDKLLRKFGDNYRDNLGKKIYHLMIPIMFPEYKGHEKYIDRITDMLFDDLNANYNLKFGRNFIVDLPPENHFHLPERSKVKDSEFDGWFDKYWAENIDYSLYIAEHIWEYNTFRQTAIDLGYSDSEIKETHRLCVEFLKEKNLFVPIEILFTKNKSPESHKAMMRYPEMIKWLFSNRKTEAALLPSYVFKNKDVVKTMLSANGSLLEFAPEFSGDRDIVMTAIQSSTYAVEFIDKSLWGDRAIAKEAARNSKYDLIFSYDAFKQFNDDDEIVMLALEANGANICYASERIRSDYDMALFALQHQTEVYPVSAYKSLSLELRSRKDLALVELHAPEPSLDGFTDNLLDDDDIAQQLIANEEITWMFYQMSERIKHKYLDKLPEITRNNIKRELHIE